MKCFLNINHRYVVEHTDGIPEDIKVYSGYSNPHQYADVLHEWVEDTTKTKDTTMNDCETKQ